MPTIWHLLSQLSASLPWLPCYSSEFSEGNIANKEILSPLIRANSCPILCTHKQTILTPPVKTDLEHLIINRLQILKPTRIKSSFWAWGEGKDWDIFASTCDASCVSHAGYIYWHKVNVWINLQTLNQQKMGMLDG